LLQVSMARPDLTRRRSRRECFGSRRPLTSANHLALPRG
jgi:hypothetical protein